MSASESRRPGPLFFLGFSVRVLMGCGLLHAAHRVSESGLRLVRQDAGAGPHRAEWIFNPGVDWHQWMPVETALVWLGGFLLLEALLLFLTFPWPAARRRLAISATHLLFLVSFFCALEQASTVCLNELPLHRDKRYGWTCADAAKLWRPESHLRTREVRTNSLGLRDDEEIEVPRPARQVRILCLGDSWTFGMGVTQNEPWPYVLQARLREHYPNQDIKVVNGGQFGYCVYQGFLTLMDPGLALDPQIVIITQFHNEVNQDLFYNLSNGNAVAKMTPRLRETLYRSATFLWLRRQVMLLRLAEVRASFTPAPSGALENFERETYEALTELARNHGIEVVALQFKEGTARGMLQRLSETAQIPLATADVRDHMLTPPDNHCNADGHALGAEAVEKMLIDSGALARAIARCTR